MTATSATQSPSSSSSALNSTGTSIAQNFDQFLMLLTAQLKNQNPMDPLDTNQFTQQLVSFASVEQQIKSNESLTSLMSDMTAQNAMSALNFAGKTITASGTTTDLKNGNAVWHLNSNQAGNATVVIKDVNGTVVSQQTVAMTGGTQDFSWNGKAADGTQLPDGKYSISVSGTDSQNNSLTITTEISGVVNKVDLTTSPPTLNIGDLSISLNAITSVE